MNFTAVITLIGGLCAFFALWFVYARLTYREKKPDARGRITITPGPVSWALALFSAALCVLFFSETIKAGVGRPEDLLFWVSLGPPLTALFGFAVYIICWTRLRASEETIEYRGLRGWETLQWDNVIGVDSHWMFGTCLGMEDARPRYVWAYGYGTAQVAEIFWMREIPFDIR